MQETQETWVRSLGWEDPLGEGMVAPSSILAGESHGRRSLEGCTPCSHIESYITACTHAGEELNPCKGQCILCMCGGGRVGDG